MSRFNRHQGVVGCIGCWDSGSSCKCVDFIAGLIFVYRNQCLNEVVFCQALSTRINPDKNIRNVFFIGGIADLQSRQGIIREIQKGINIIFNSVFFLVSKERDSFFVAALIHLFYETPSKRANGIILFCQKHIADAADPLGVSLKGLGPNCKFLRQGIIGDLDFAVRKMLVLYLDGKHCRNKGS